MFRLLILFMSKVELVSEVTDSNESAELAPGYSAGWMLASHKLDREHSSKL